jgi:hypothetical protein
MTLGNMRQLGVAAALRHDGSMDWASWSRLVSLLPMRRKHRLANPALFGARHVRVISYA